MSRTDTRSALGRAKGLGPAKDGSEHWWRERVSAIALVPLTFWFIASMLAYSRAEYDVFVAWLRTPFPVLMMTLLLIAVFYHTALGLQVIIEDYVHSAAKIPALVVARLGCLAFAAAGILAVLHIAFRS
jgi:succinate dehydrogenase membrane anchor subunit